MSIRRIPLKQWEIKEDNGFVQLIVNGMLLLTTISMGWRVSLETSNVFPEMLGIIIHKGVATPVWLYKGHLWLVPEGTAVEGLLHKAANTNKRPLPRPVKSFNEPIRPPSRYVPQWVRIHVTQRDGGRCVYCGESDPRKLEFDHRKAYARGGPSDDPSNICLGCITCNRRKGAKDWGWQ